MRGQKQDPGDARVPEWAEDKPIACIQGPFDGQWFTSTEWEHRLRAAKRMVDLLEKEPITYARRSGKATKQKVMAILGYVPTGKKFQHPAHGTVFGDAWVYRPKQ